MPSPNPTTRREYKGGAALAHLAAGIGATDTSFTLDVANNWPTGAVGNFIVTINQGFSDEERILCSAQSSRVVTVAASGRGFDGTTAASHNTGATVQCTFSGFDADEWNAHTAATSGVHGVAGPVADTNSAQTFINKTLTQPVIGDFTNAGHDHSTVAAGGNIPLSSLTGGAWATYTPTWSAAAGAALSTAIGRYQLLGPKTVHTQIRLVASGTAATGLFGVTLPFTPQSGNVFEVLGCGGWFRAATGLFTTGIVIPYGSSNVVQLVPNGSATGVTSDIAVGDQISLDCIFEAA